MISIQSKDCITIFYTSKKSWRGYIFTAVCLCVCVCLSVCVSVCLALLVNKIPVKRMYRFGRGFLYMAAYNTDSNPVEIGDLGSKVKVTVTQGLYPFFLHNSLLTSLFCISALLCLIIMKFSLMSLRYSVIMTLFMFSPNNCLYQDFYWTYKLRTWNQYTTSI